MERCPSPPPRDFGSAVECPTVSPRSVARAPTFTVILLTVWVGRRVGAWVGGWVTGGWVWVGWYTGPAGRVFCPLVLRIEDRSKDAAHTLGMTRGERAGNFIEGA